MTTETKFTVGEYKTRTSREDLMPPLREFWRVEGFGDFSSLESAEEFVKLRPREKQLEITKYREVRDDQA